MNDRWTERLSEYLDDELTAAERAALEAHLADCPECATTLDDLRRVALRARTLDDDPPGTDLWPAIAQRIGLAQQRPRTRRLSLTMPQLLAASIALILLSVGGGRLFMSRSRTGSPVVATAPQAGAITRTSWTTDRRYDDAVAQLEAALEEGRKNGRLDSVTVRVVARNLAIIDTAIGQARRALAADPGSAYLNHHLAESMQRKLDLLRSAAVLVTART